MSCVLMGAIGKKAGSGFEEIFLEAGICASGSLSKVMSGKHYNQAMRVYQLLLEACERLFLQSFTENYELLPLILIMYP